MKGKCSSNSRQLWFVMGKISQGSMRIVTSCCVRFSLPGSESRNLEDSIAPVCAKLSINTMALTTLGKNLCAINTGEPKTFHFSSEFKKMEAYRL